jgi:predicted nucleic acid-binding protein
MRWLLDTNVVSEPGKKRPNAAVLKWLDTADEEDCAISVITIGEIESGIQRLPEGAFRRDHEQALDAIRHRFAGRILGIDDVVATRWGVMAGSAAAEGRTLPAIDCLVGATAVVHGLTVVTRNGGDFSDAVPVFDPFG